MPLHVVKGTPPPDTPKERIRARRRATKPADILQCHRCGGREMIETRIGVTVQGGKTKGGTRQICCAACWMQGERVVLA